MYIKKFFQCLKANMRSWFFVINYFSILILLYLRFCAQAWLVHLHSLMKFERISVYFELEHDRFFCSVYRLTHELAFLGEILESLEEHTSIKIVPADFKNTLNFVFFLIAVTLKFWVIEKWGEGGMFRDTAKICAPKKKLLKSFQPIRRKSDFCIFPYCRFPQILCYRTNFVMFQNMHT